MEKRSEKQSFGSGETCPECEIELVIVIGGNGLDQIECDCGATRVLSAA